MAASFELPRITKRKPAASSASRDRRSWPGANYPHLACFLCLLLDTKCLAARGLYFKWAPTTIRPDRPINPRAFMDPLIFESYARPQVWGQRRLQTKLDKRLPADGMFGESWEISAHPHHVSRVAEGPLAGKPLDVLWRDHGREIFGDRAVPEKFPLLIKYLDCHEQLSVQVHPNDQIADELSPGEAGKTEAWVILDAEPS